MRFVVMVGHTSPILIELGVDYERGEKLAMALPHSKGKVTAQLYMLLVVGHISAILRQHMEDISMSTLFSLS